MRTKGERFQKRAQRVRTKISKVIGNRCRLSITKSNANIYAQVIDDAKGIVVVSASTLEKDVKSALTGMNKCNVKAAAHIGKLIGERANSAGVKDVVFDRGGYLYHGCVKAFADSARNSGLKL